MKKNVELYKALQLAEREAIKQSVAHEMALKDPPLCGWTVERHIAYHKKHQQEAVSAAQWLFVRMMQIDPD